ncbi:unnamed protein product, partial [Larinioides sclopetarius]
MKWIPKKLNSCPSIPLGRVRVAAPVGDFNMSI